jgi:dihydroorotase
MTMNFLLILLGTAALLAQPASAQPYDLVLKGGHVIDPRNKIDRVMDVAVKDGKIAAVAENITAVQAKQTVDVAGLYVTPGLVDIHVHVYAGTGMRGAYSGDNSVYPDGFTFRTGVTTVVDAGSSGWRNFPDFKDRVIDRSQTRVLALLNIVGKGMGGDPIEQNLDDMDPAATAKVMKQFPETIVGVKSAHYRGPEWDPVDRAVKAAAAGGGVVMVDFGEFRKERPFEELVLEHLRPGDMYTHTYLGRVPMLDAEGRVRPYLFEARKRGVKFDVGHGGGSFWWSQAVPAIKQGFRPDSISTDLHIGSMNAGMKTMLEVMSKILNQDVPLYDVIAMSTANPANQIHRTELGHLSVGAAADIAVIRQDQGKFGFLDVNNALAYGAKRLVGELTLRDGKVVWDLNGRAGVRWEEFYKKK